MMELSQIPILISADTTEYHVIVTALDAAGNAANLVEVELHLE